jgi:hypothetical protein
VASKLDVSRVPQAGPEAVFTLEGLGLESAQDAFLPNKAEVLVEFPKDEEAQVGCLDWNFKWRHVYLCTY